MIKAILISLLFLWKPLSCAEGKFINPITDICWSCLFPLHIAGANVTPKDKDYVTYKELYCHCNGGIIGLPFAYWEPSRLIEVTRTPYKFLGLGGLSFGEGNVKKRGTTSTVGGIGRKSFYHVHYYQYPIVSLLNLQTNLVCVEDFDFDIAYMSELDPLWGDDKWSAVLHPESLVFANPIAQAACIADCASSSFNMPLDKLFWCAGCQGSLYPFIGHIAHHVGPLQASSLLVHRLLAKLHAMGILWGYTPDNFCEKKPMIRLDKRLYKTQLIYPVAQTKGPCNPLGKSDLFWGANKSYPYGGEDFIFLIWTKKQCCLDPAKIAIDSLKGGLF